MTGSFAGSSTDTYEVYAVKYGERDARRPEHFLGGDPHDVPMNMDYFVWVAVGADRTFVIDTGFATDDGVARGRRALRTATEGLALIGVDAADDHDVVLTHLHYDHAGGVRQFSGSRFHVQDREMAFATGRQMTHRVFNHAYTARHVADLVVAVYDGRVSFHSGDAELTPGLSLHHVGGHTDGLQVVRIATTGGWLVLASDATHYYENIETARPFPIAFDVGAMVAGYDTLRKLAGRDGVIVPGHDPMVFERHVAADPSLNGIAVRLG
jgi:glyoxylase-like metal-dependent hydrolase (beta-lactamase superfamily II)